MGYSYLNLGSFLLGIAAIAFAIAGIVRKSKAKQPCLYTILSLFACLLSIYYQMLYGNHLVQIGDFTAIMDTAHAVVMLSGVLLLLTVILNFVALIKLRNR